MQLAKGTLLHGGKYKIERVLGQGGFGITYLAEQVMLGRKVAIKEFFFKQYCGRDESTSQVYVPISENTQIVAKFKKKFIGEANMLMNLNHDNIIKVYDSFEENNTSYYVMELVEGGSLKSLIEQRGCIPEEEAIGYVKKVGDALGYIHSKNMMHLDIKPDNIMLGRNGKVTVIDFGVSKLYDIDTGNSLTTATTVGVSNGYSPFEQTYSGGVKSFSPQSDVYALAATLYKLLTGVTPPPSPSVKDNGLPLKPLKDKGISDNVVNAIINAMRTRNVRTQSVKEFLKQLDDEGTIVIDETTVLANDLKTNKTNVFSYPLTISVNKTIYTDCQQWIVKTIKLLENKTVVMMSVSSYDQPTTTWSGSGKIRTDEGVVYKQTGTNLPKYKDDSFVIDPWQSYNVVDVYPAIPESTTGFSLLNDNVIIKGIELSDNRTYVPDANSEHFDGITRAGYESKKRGGGIRQHRVEQEKSEFSIVGFIYIIVIIGIIILALKFIIS